MDWLTHNPLADMYGPVFLAFYAAVVALTVAAVWFGRRALDWTGSMTTPVVPPEPDPFEVAYLRGGENEVTRSVIFTLVQKGLLEVKQEGDDFLVAPAPATPERRHLSPIERRTLDWFAAPQKVSRIFKDDGLAPHLKPFCAAYEQRLRRENFLPPAEMLGGARLLRWAGVLVLAGLASYKILIALSRGRFNVLFLVALAAVGLVLVFRVSRQPRLTGRGRAYLERLQLAFERLKNRPAASAGGTSPRATQPLAPASNVAGATGGPALAAYDPTLPLLVGVFGVTALAGTQYDYFQQSFRRSAVNGGAEGSVGSGCGSSCGSSDSPSDGSSGGDGGGSSCGSSCGGGGCGGCGS